MSFEIHTMGEYWWPDRDERTPLGELVHRAKDLGDRSAMTDIADQFSAYVDRFDHGPGARIVAIPPSPDRPSPLLDLIVEVLLERTALSRDAGVVRHHTTSRLRDLPPLERPAVAEAAGYEVIGGGGGEPVVLIDDVVLTGTTLGHVARLLVGAGASTVTAFALVRSRRR